MKQHFLSQVQTTGIEEGFDLVVKHKTKSYSLEKNAEKFFAAVRLLMKKGLHDFEVAVVNKVVEPVPNSSENN